MPQCSACNIKIYVEVPVLLIFFAFIVSDSVKTNLIIYRTCYVTLGYNKSECALLGSKYADNQTANLEKIVEPYAAVVNMVHSMTNAFFSAFICLFVGPWSDRFGRKPVLIIPVIGFILGYILTAVFAAWETLSPWYQILCSIPVYLGGGVSSYMTVVLCYITDVTSEGSRGVRMGVFEAVLSLGIFLGNVTSSYIFTATNYPTVFLVSALCCLLALLYTIFFIPESLTNPESEGYVKELFSISNIVDMMKTTFKKRENFNRYCVLSCLLMLTVFITIINGDESVVFLYLRESFHWTLEKYTLYSAAHNVIWVLGTIVGVYLIHKLLNIPESIMILIGFMSMFNSMVVMGIAHSDWDVYFTALLRPLGSVISPMVRSLVSKIVPNDDVGKIFALIVISESMFGMIGSPLYTAIYNATISENSGVYNFFSAGLYLFEILIAISIIVVRTFKKDENVYNELENEDITSQPEQPSPTVINQT